MSSSRANTLTSRTCHARSWQTLTWHCARWLFAALRYPRCQRTNFGRENFHPHNILISVLGAALLWVGWMGFNGYASLLPFLCALRWALECASACKVGVGCSLLHDRPTDAAGAGSGTAGSAGVRAAIACLNTQISAATGSLSWMTTEWFIRKRPSVLGIISGALAVPAPAPPPTASFPPA
jgi:Amt family ammonium transporter